VKRIKSFKRYLNEGRYPMWVRVSVGVIVMKIRNLQTLIDSEEDSHKRDRLLSQQNTLLSYISGLGIGISSNDTVLMKKMKNGLGLKK